MRRLFFMDCLLPYVCFTFLRWVKFCGGCFRQVFFIWETKKAVADPVRRLVVLYSNDRIGTCMGGLSVGRLRRVAVV